MNDLATLIQSTRKQKGMTQVALSRATGISQGTISRIETGTYKETPGPELLGPIAEALDIPEAELLRSSGYRVDAIGTVVPAPYDAVSAQIVRTLDRWTHERRAWLLSLMEGADALQGNSAPTDDDAETTA